MIVKSSGVDVVCGWNRAPTGHSRLFTFFCGIFPLFDLLNSNEMDDVIIKKSNWRLALFKSSHPLSFFFSKSNAKETAGALCPWVKLMRQQHRFWSFGNANFIFLSLFQQSLLPNACPFPPLPSSIFIVFYLSRREILNKIEILSNLRLFFLCQQEVELRRRSC